MFEPHRVELPHLAPQVLQGQVGLGLSQLAGGQLLLQAGDVVLGYVLPLALTGLGKEGVLFYHRKRRWVVGGVPLQYHQPP